MILRVFSSRLPHATTQGRLEKKTYEVGLTPEQLILERKLLQICDHWNQCDHMKKKIYIYWRNSIVELTVDNFPKREFPCTDTPGKARSSLP